LELRPCHDCRGERPVRGGSRALPGRHAGPGSDRELWPRGPGGFLGIVYVANVVGPPPPSAEAVAIVCFLGVGLIIAGAAWVDRYREAIAG
jgi:hypothetical protein